MTAPKAYDPNPNGRQGGDDHDRNPILPPTRTYVVRRYTRGNTCVSDELDEKAVECHTVHSVGGDVRFVRLEMIGGELETRVIWMLAPGTWYDFRDVTKDMTVRPA